MTPIARSVTAVVLGSLALLAVAGEPRPALAAEAASPAGSLSIPVEVEGSVQVEFAANPATGCPDPCDVSGSVAWEPAGDAQLEVDLGARHRPRLEGLLVFFGGLGQNGPRTTAQVIRGRSDGTAGACSDARTADLLVLDFSARSDSFLQARLVRGEPDDSDVFRSRCGGPIESDLLAALPSARIDRATLLEGRTSVDLSGTRTFAAHGFAGTVRSSLSLRLGRARAEVPIRTFATPPRPPTSALRTVTAVYRVERVAGSVETTFGSVAERSLCEPLDVCGASGSVRLEPLVSSGRATFFAYGSARRTTGHDLRAALGLVRGRHARGITALGGADWTQDGGHASESFTDAFGNTCRDSAPLGAGFMTFWVGPRRVFAGYGRGPDSGFDPLRTRCPGPSLLDAAQDHPLAAGNVSRKAFRKRSVVITLARGRTFESQPYRGESRPALTIVLRRLSVREHVDFVPVGVF